MSVLLPQSYNDMLRYERFLMHRSSTDNNNNKNNKQWEDDWLHHQSTSTNNSSVSHTMLMFHAIRNTLFNVVVHHDDDENHKNKIVPFFRTFRTTSMIPVPFSTVYKFLPDYTEHPKPKKIIVRKNGGGGGVGGGGGDNNGDDPKNNKKEEDDDAKNRKKKQEEKEKSEETMKRIVMIDDDQDTTTICIQPEREITFFHDFIGGGVAGTASVIVGHPFDTIKVRLQTSISSSSSIKSTFTEFGGISSLFSGMAAPLCTAALVNAIIFGSYGISSRFYNDIFTSSNTIIIPDNDDNNDNNIDAIITSNHDPWQKATVCGSFAGLMQAIVICPMEHVKCRLQTQHGKGSMDYKYKGPIQATRSIIQEFGIQRLYQGWCSTLWREIPAFGLYFSLYDYLKDQANEYLASNMDVIHNTPLSSSSGTSTTTKDHSHTWLASAFAGGCAGSFTWAIIYPFDIIKTRIQTAPLNTPLNQLRIMKIGSDIVRQHGVKYLFRGLGVTLMRAFPVNGTIFPVYEFTLKHVCKYTDER